MIQALVSGFALGWIGSMPIAGAVSVFACERGLAGRFRGGLALAAGAALAEASWCLVVLYGAGELFARWPALAGAARTLGGLFLLGLGVYFLVRRARVDGIRGADPRRQINLRGEFRLGFTLVAVNPAIPVNWLALIAVAVGFGLDPHTSPPAFSAGVAVGVVGWFALLLRLLITFRQQVHDNALARVQRGLGFLLLVAGTIALLRAWL